MGLSPEYEILKTVVQTFRHKVKKRVSVLQCMDCIIYSMESTLDKVLAGAYDQI
jgi:hypothetical protein